MLPRLLNLTRARELMAREGVDALVAQLPINVYCLSGYWGCLPKPLGVQLGTKPDQVLEPGVVISVDMPYTEIGRGSLHLEDTVLVTADGHELLTSADLGLRCVTG